MTEKSDIETKIEAFVARKTAEAVYVDVGDQDTISVKHRSIHGSIALSIFWINVLQHPNNYPPKHFPYKKHYNSQGPYKIVLRTQDVTISVCMKTGALSIQGVFVIEWFLDTFLSILSGYESPPGPPRPVKGMFKEIEDDYKKVMRTQKRRQVDDVNQMRRIMAEKTVDDTLQMPPSIYTVETPKEEMPEETADAENEDSQIEKVDEIPVNQVEESETVDEDQNAEAETVQPEEEQVVDEAAAETEDGLTQEEVVQETAGKEEETQEENEPIEPAEDVSPPNLEETQEIILDAEKVDVEKENVDEDENSQQIVDDVDEKITITEPIDEGVLSEQEDKGWQEMLSSMDLWPEDILQKELEKLKYPCIKDGPSYIYTMWKSLLDLWFSDQNRKVYIAAPVLDVERLQDICNIFLQHRLTACLDVMYVTQDLKHIAKLRRSTLDSYNVNEQIFLEYKVLNSMVFPPKNFQARFIAAAKDGKVDILVTSAGFHRDYFCKSSDDTLIFQTIDEAAFTKKFMKQLHSRS